METEIYKREEILKCDYNEAIKECIYVINSHSKTGSHNFNCEFRYEIGEPLRTKIISDLILKLKRP